MRHKIISMLNKELLLFHEQKPLLFKAMIIKSLKMVILPSHCRAILIVALFASGCGSPFSGEHSSIQGKQRTAATKPVHQEVGKASWYGSGFQGKKTANGETYNQKEMTAAHPSLPMGTKAKVTNLENGKKVEVMINDRGPYADDRVIDLSGAQQPKNLI
jgi:rare lipoprotein A